MKSDLKNKIQNRESEKKEENSTTTVKTDIVDIKDNNKEGVLRTADGANQQKTNNSTGSATGDSKRQGRRRRKKSKKTNNPLGEGKNSKGDSHTRTSDAQNGTKAGSKQYVNEASKEDSGDNNNSQIPEDLFQLNVIEKNNNSTINNEFIDARVYNNAEFKPEDIAAEKANLGRSFNQGTNYRKLAKTKKQVVVFAGPTIDNNYKVDDYDLERDITDRNMVSPVRDENRNFVMPYFATTINTLGSLNYSGYDPRILKIKRRDIKLTLKTFTSKPVKEHGIGWYVRKASSEEANLEKIENTSLELSQLLATRSKSRALMNGQPVKLSGLNNDTLEYSIKEFKGKINETKDGKIDPSFRNNIGDMRKSISLRNFLTNFEVLTQSNPELIRYYSFARNTPELGHFHINACEMGTGIRMLLLSVKYSLRGSSFIAKKTGLVDSTLKFLVGSPIASKLQTTLNILAAWASILPFDDYIIQRWLKDGEWSLLNELDPLSELNPLLIRSYVLVGDAVDDKNWGQYIPFRDNDAAPAIVVGLGSPWHEILKSTVNHYKWKNAAYTNKDYSISNQAMFNGFDRDKNTMDLIEAPIISLRRITRWLQNKLIELTTQVDLNEKFDEYFRKVGSFLDIYKIEGLLAGTDWKLETIDAPNLFSFEDDTPAVIKNPAVLSGQHLATDLSEVQLLKTDELQLGERIPRTNIFISNGDEKVSYSNYIGFIWVRDFWKFTKDKQAIEFNDNGTMKERIEVNVDLEAINVYDHTIMNFIPTDSAVIGGWHDGVTFKGEVYNFKTGVNDLIQFQPTCFEYTYAYSASFGKFNEAANAAVPANYDHMGYFTMHNLYPLLSMTKNKNSISYVMYKYNKWNRLPFNYFAHNDELIKGLEVNPFTPFWKVSVAQLNRNYIYKGLSPLATGLSWEDAPHFEKSGLDKVN